MSDYSSIARDIAAGVLAAMMSFGAADYSKGATYGKAPYSETSRSARNEAPYTMQLSDGGATGKGYSSSYSNELVGWLDDIGYGSNGYLKSVFKSNMTDEMKYTVAMAFHGDITGKSGGSGGASKMLYLEPYKNADGSFGYLDRGKGYVVAMAKKMPSGIFAYEGTEEFIPKLFGRGELSTLADRTADGDYWNKT